MMAVFSELMFQILQNAAAAREKTLEAVDSLKQWILTQH